MANVQYYDVILKPVITEKSMELMADKKYTFLEEYLRIRRLLTKAGVRPTSQARRCNVDGERLDGETFN